MSRFLVTGAKGLLGSRLVELATAGGHHIDALVRGPLDQCPANVHPIEADLHHPLDRSLLPAKIDAVFHLAQSRLFRQFPEGARDVFEINVARTAELLDYSVAAGARHFVLASTGSVYAASEGIIHEDFPLAAKPGFYAASKRAAELIAQPYRAHLCVTILRYFFIYGRAQQADMLIPRLISSVREDRPIRLQRGNGPILNPVHVSDAAAATLAAATLEESVTANVAGPQGLTLRDIGMLIGAQLGREPRFEADDEPHVSWVADTTLMRRVLIQPAMRMEAGIGEMI